MQNVITLTKALTLPLLLLVFAGASASAIQSGDGKDTIKCKKHCCRKEAEKEVQVAMKEFNEAMKELSVQLKNLDAEKMKVEVVQSLAQLPVKLVKTTNGFMLAYVDVDNAQEETKQKLDFNNLDKEMDKVQEGMTQMDPSLKKDDAKSRKPAEELLRTGIKS